MCHLSYFCCGKSIVIYLINLCLIMLNQTLKSLFVCQTKQILMYNCYLCVVYTHTGSPDGQRSGRHTYGKRRFCTLWFWRYKNLANSTTSQEQSNKERLMRCIIYSPHWLRTIPLFVVKSAFYILTLAWGFRRCSFRQIGRCQSLYTWNEWQNRLHALSYVLTSKKFLPYWSLWV